jgi:predicted  nucleic acid-binding Zn-ribbon protein
LNDEWCTQICAEMREEMRQLRLRLDAIGDTKRIERMEAAIDRIDQRQQKQETTVARLMGAIALAAFAASFLGALLQKGR